jgi:chemotaxis protein MotB
MARKRREEEPDNHERWLVSYADFITLLFAFFVVMYAISSVNEGKYKVLSNSLTNAFKNSTAEVGGQPIAVIQGAPPIPPRPILKPDKLPEQIKAEEKKAQQRQKMKNVANNIMEALQPLVAQGKVRLLETSRGVTIEINDSILFPAGQSKLQPASSSMVIAVPVRIFDHDRAYRQCPHFNATVSIKLGALGHAGNDCLAFV